MTRRTTRLKRVATVVPLALVSAAWTTHLAGAGVIAPSTTAAPAAPIAKRTLPDGTRLPGAPIDYPASLSDPDDITATDAGFTQVAATSSSGDIPSSALAAYQRAETVINAADPSCRVSWQLLAAVGRVESNHGRFGGSALDVDGVAAPSIIGPVLDGHNGTAIITDTDAGQYDGDSRYDRAVGPMQFIPSTWSVVGVDADNDGERNPHDIDDAALAAAVYLCSGSEDLSTLGGQKIAVHRYNHSDAYVQLVLSIMRGYLQGDFSAGPGSILSARPTLVDPLVPLGPFSNGLETAATPFDTPTTSAQPVTGLGAETVGEPVGVELDEPAAPVEPETPVDPQTPVDPAAPADPATPTDPTEGPTDGPAEEPTEPTDPAEPPTEEPTDPAEPPTEEPTEPTDPAEPGAGVGTMTPEDAATHCAEAEGLADDPASTEDAYDLCVEANTIPAQDESVPGAPGPAPLRDESTPPRD